VILFGSQASRQAGKGSDIDLLICLNDHHPLAKARRGERAGAVLDLFRYRSFGLDVIVLSQDEIRGLQEANEGEWDLVLEILAQGKVLYERKDLAATE
jgi:predicted nucleotidyltransferase